MNEFDEIVFLLEAKRNDLALEKLKVMRVDFRDDERLYYFLGFFLLT